MSFLDKLKQIYSIGDGFTPNDVSIKLKMDEKVCSMILKKLSNKLEIGYYSNINTYYILSDDEVLKLKKEYNEFVDKYKLKNKKIKL